MELKAKKAAQHRQAIAQAASMQTGRPGPETNDKSKKAVSGSGKGSGIEALSNSFTASTTLNNGKEVVLTPDASDDYEGSKVNRHKRNLHDEDIRMVQDLDRWG